MPLIPFLFCLFTFTTVCTVSGNFDFAEQIFRVFVRSTLQTDFARKVHSTIYLATDTARCERAGLENTARSPNQSERGICRIPPAHEQRKK